MLLFPDETPEPALGSGRAHRVHGLGGGGRGARRRLLADVRAQVPAAQGDRRHAVRQAAREYLL